MLRSHQLGVLATAGALTAALFTIPAPAGAGSPAPAVDAVDTTRLRDAVTVRGILDHEREFQRIADANDGTRASGTTGYDASAAYVARTLREAGYRVTLQPFTFAFFQELAPAELSQISPTPTDYETATLEYSRSGDVTGTVVPTRDVVLPPTPAPSSTSGCEPSDFRRAPAGPAIALVQRGTCTFADKASNAEAAGYDAVVIFNEGQPGRDALLEGTLGEDSTATVPVVGLDFADGRDLVRAARAGTVTARVATSTVADPNRRTVNVIADSPRGRKAGETVVVGAHLDSVTDGAGINDNGSGSATILEIAQQLSELNYTSRLQRQVRFAFWGAEEAGLLGSQYYVDNLKRAQRDAIYANLNFDMLGSPNYVRFVYDGDGSDGDVAGPPGSAEIEKIFTDYFEDQGLASEPTDFNGRSDYGPFIATGIPAGGLFSGAEGVKTAEQAATYGGTADAPYDACYHQDCDDLTNLSTKALFELGDAAAHATAVLLLSRAGIYPDGSFTGPTAAPAPGTGSMSERGHTAIR